MHNLLQRLASFLRDRLFFHKPEKEPVWPEYLQNAAQTLATAGYRIADFQVVSEPVKANTAILCSYEEL